MAMILAHYGRFVTLEELRQVSGVSRDCINATDLVRIAKYYHLEVKVLRREPNQLKEMEFPLVVYLNFIHFVVVEGMTHLGVEINDPACGRYCLPLEEFDGIFTGIVLTFAPMAGFQKGGTAPTLGAQVGRFLSAGVPELLLALSLGILGNLLLILFAWQAQVLVSGYPAEGISWRVASSLMGVVFLRGMLALVQKKIVLRLQFKLSAEGASRLLQHLLTLPYAFFVYRIPAVLQSRINDQEECARWLCQTLLPALFSLLGLPILIFAFFFIVGLKLGLVVSIATALYLLLISQVFLWGGGAFRRMRNQSDESWFKLSQAVHHFESFKTGAGGMEFFSDSMSDTSVSVRYRQVFGLFQGFAEASPELFMAVLLLLIPANVPTAALILVFALLAPLRDLSMLYGKGDLLRQKLSFLADLKAQIPEGAPNQRTDAGGEKVCSVGQESLLAVSNVEFGFSKAKPALITEVSLQVSPGEFLGITGPSGCGKSTLGQLLVGLHKPWKGTIHLYGKPVSSYSREQLAKSIAWVNKQPFFFSGSLRDNLCLWHQDISETALLAAISDACLEDVIKRLPEGLDAPVDHRGANFSGGQRQRMEIARALLLDPKILVLDEATDGLDHALEQALRANLKKRGMTLIIVSHRASTLAECDRVVRMADGRLVETLPQKSAPSRNVFFESEEDPSLPSMKSGATRKAMFHCFSLVAGKIANAPVTVPSDPAPEEEGCHAPEADLALLAKRNGMALRSVRFVVHAWWRRDHGPLVGFTREGRHPVAILPHQDGYLMVNPETGVQEKLTLQAARCLESTAYMVYSRHDSKGTAPLRFFLHDAFRLRSDLGGALAASGLIALLYAVIPMRFLHLAQSHHERVALVLIATALVLSEISRVFFLLRIEGRLQLNASSALYQQVMLLQPLFLGRKGPEAIALSVRSVPRILEVFGTGALRRILGMAVCLAGVVMIAGFSMKMALFAVLLLIPMMGALLVARTGNQWARRLLPVILGNRRFLLEMLKAMPKLKQMGREWKAFDYWKTGHKEEVRLSRRLENATLLAASFTEVYPWFAAACFLMLVKGAAAELAMFVAFLIADFSLQSVTTAGAEWVKARPLTDRLKVLSEAPLEPSPWVRPGDANQVQPVDRQVAETIDMHHVEFTYPDCGQPAIRDVSMRIRPGEFVALAGPSGSGKSTLLRLLLGFYLPDKGRVLRNGKPHFENDLTGWRDRVGAVLQDDQLDTAMSIRGHIAGMCTPYTLAEIRSAARLAQLEGDIDAMPMGIQSIVDSEKISTGQKQRLLMARRLLRRPDLLILDEATNALPENMQAELFGNLRKLGMACLIVSHRASAIAAADCVYLMDKGKMVWNGSPAEFFSRGLHVKEGEEDETSY